MSTSTIEVSLAIRLTNRWPYRAVRVLGPRAGAEHDELVVPLIMKIDSALLRRRTDPVRVDVPAPDAPTAAVQS